MFTITEIKDISEEFKGIAQKYLYKPMTAILKDQIWHEYYYFFEKHGLSDIKYRIDFHKNNSSIQLVPIRNIDDLAISFLNLNHL